MEYDELHKIWQKTGEEQKKIPSIWILKNEITKKGAVLTQMSKFWFDMTEDILLTI